MTTIDSVAETVVHPTSPKRVSPFSTLGHDLIVYGLMGAVSKSVALLLLPFFSRQFSPAQYGMLEIVLTFSALLAVFVSLNLESAVARMWIDSEGRLTKRDLVSSTLALTFIVGSISLVGVASASGWIASMLLGDGSLALYLVLGAGAAFAMALGTVPQIVLRMERRIAHYNCLLLVQSLGYFAVGIVLVVHFQLGVKGALIGLVFGQVAGLVLGLWWVRGLVARKMSLEVLNPALRYSLPMLPAVVATWVNRQMDKVILLAFLGLAAVGVLGATARLALIIGFVVALFQQAWTPLALATVNDEGLRDDFYRRALNYYAATLAGISFVTVAFGLELFRMLLPSGYVEGHLVLPWILGTTVVYGAASITNLGMLVSKRTVGNSIAAWIGSAVNVTLGLLLIPAYGIRGAAIGGFVAAISFTAVLGFWSTRVTGLRFDVPRVVGIMLVFCAGAIGVVAIHGLASNPVVSLVGRGGLVVGVIWALALLGADAHVRQFVRDGYASAGHVKARN